MQPLGSNNLKNKASWKRNMKKREDIMDENLIKKEMNEKKYVKNKSDWEQ